MTDRRRWRARNQVARWAPRPMAWWLWRGQVVLLTVLVGAALLFFNGVRQQRHAIATALGQQQLLEEANLQASADFADARAVLRAYLLTRARRFLVFYRIDQKHLASALGRAGRMATGAAPRRDVAIEVRSARTWFSYADKMRGLSASDPALARLTAAGGPSVSAFRLANEDLYARIRAQSRQDLAVGQRDLRTAIGWSGALALVALLTGFAAAAVMIRGATRPLAGLTWTLRQLASGDRSVRAAVAGPAEVQEVARSLNELADESERLRQREEEGNRLRAMAREVGIRIREHLRPQDVIHQARAAIEENIDADVVYLRIIRGGEMGPREGRVHEWVLPEDFMASLTPAALAYVNSLLRSGSSAVTQDMSGPEADILPSEIRDQLRQAGVVSHLLTPFGVGPDLLGVIAAERTRPGHPWTQPEVAAVELIAADLGRGLHHAWLYEEESKVVDELKWLDRAKSDFLATVSHELRTPLTSIAGYVELLADRDAGPLNEVQGRMLEVIDRNTGRLRSLIEDVLTLSKIESGAFRTSIQPVDVVEVASSVVTALLPTAAANGIGLSLGAPTEGLVVSGDPGQLDRALMNVVSNALKFSPDGEVRVSVGADDGWALVTVRDTGIGISPEDQKHLSTRFFRGRNAIERSIPGTGLGLAIVRTIMDNHGGSLDLESTEGRGTTVALRIPLLTASRRANRRLPPAPERGGDLRAADPGALPRTRIRWDNGGHRPRGAPAGPRAANDTPRRPPCRSDSRAWAWRPRSACSSPPRAAKRLSRGSPRAAVSRPSRLRRRPVRTSPHLVIGLPGSAMRGG